MKIFCPTCDTSIEVSKFLVGQKGRCPTCATKFLIPESPDDEMEILEQGEIPEGYTPPAPEPEPVKEKPKAKTSSASSKKKKSSSTKAKPASAATGGARRVVPATGAPTRTAAKPVVVKQSSGAFGFLFAIVLAGLVGVIVYVMMERQKVQQLAAEQEKNQQNEPAKTVVETDKPKPAPRPIAPIEPVNDPAADAIPVFAKVIKPVLEAKCVTCHGGEKIKARLEMNTYEKLIAGGGNGSIITPDADDPKRIEMIFRAELPESDDEHMPPSGKPQLTPDELAILKWWIKEGAHEQMESSEAPDDIRKKIKELAKL